MSEYEHVADLLGNLLNLQPVMVNEYLAFYKKRKKEDIFVFAKDYRKGYWAEAPLARSELLSLLKVLLAPPEKWQEMLAQPYILINGYVRVEKGKRDGVLLVAVSDYRTNYNGTAIYFADDRERFVTLLENVKRIELLEEANACLEAELFDVAKLKEFLEEENERLKARVAELEEKVEQMARRPDRRLESVIDYLVSLVRRLHVRAVSIEELAFRVVLSEPLSSYGEDAPLHVKAARQLQSLGEQVKVGDTISFVVVKGGVKPSHLARLEEVDVDWYIDYLTVKLTEILAEARREARGWPVGQRVICPKCGREGKAGISTFKAKGRKYVYYVVNHADARKCIIARADSMEDAEKSADLAASEEVDKLKSGLARLEEHVHAQVAPQASPQGG
jgi:polyhydroxyalkanoate synthesis regulator phasin